MHKISAFGFVALAFALFTVASPSRSANDETSHAAHGIVKDLDAKAGTVTIDHENIPGVMMAMTMTYAVADPAVLQNVAVGQAIDFRLRKNGDNFVVTEIKTGKQKATSDSHGGMSCCDSCEGMGCGDGETHDGMNEHHGHHEMN
jgi:Cu/Ag efflux protein CusF